MTGPASASSGATIPYTITVTNVGSAPAALATVNVTLPAGSTRALTFSAVAPGASAATTVSLLQPGACAHRTK